MEHNELYAVIKQLRSVLVSCGRNKHTPYLIARKEVVFPLIDKAMELLSTSAGNTSESCNLCPLYRRERNRISANNTLNRIAKIAWEDPNAPFTVDEIGNIMGLLDLKNFGTTTQQNPNCDDF